MFSSLLQSVGNPEMQKVFPVAVLQIYINFNDTILLPQSTQRYMLQQTLYFQLKTLPYLLTTTYSY